jgi:outer membrane immunogenic protein
MKHLVWAAAVVLIFSTGLPKEEAAAEGLAPTSRIAARGPVGLDWNGLYVGAGIGMGVVAHDLSGEQGKKACKKDPNNPNLCLMVGPDGDEGVGDIGLFGTVTVGYDRLLQPGWIGGVFADYDFGSGIASDVSFNGSLVALDRNSSWAVGVRFGGLVGPATLLYGTVGYTQADFAIGSLGSTTFEGYFVGAGIETFLREKWTLKLEYRYSDFGSENIINDEHANADLEPSLHTARLVLSYRFGNSH